MKPIALSDILHYRFLSNLRFSPDGERAAFVVATADEENNAYEQRLWLYEQGRVRQLTDLGKEGRFQWLDENRLLFPAVRSAKEKKRAEAGEEFTSFYVLDLRGGEALPFLSLPVAVGGFRVLDAEHLALTVTVDKSRPQPWLATEEEKKDAAKEKEENKDYEVFDETPFWFNGGGVVNGKRDQLLICQVETGKLTALTQAPEELLGFTVLGDEVFFASNVRGAKQSLLGFSLRACNWKTGGTRQLLRREDLSFAALEAVGEELWIFASETRRYGLNENSWVYALDPRGGELRLLRREEYCLYNSTGSDCRLGGGRQWAAQDGSLYHLTTREGNCVLYRMDPDGSDTPVLTREGSIDAFDLHGDRLLLIGLYDMRPQELYECRLGEEPRRVSDLNGEAIRDRYIARPEALHLQSRGLEIEGWVLKPMNFDPAKRYPAVLDIHGGPKTVYGPLFYHEMQVWAGLGYFVFFCNPKGSDGRDNEFADIRGGYGTTDYENLMDFTDAVLEAYPQIDPERVCETGGSYGGFMTNWIIGHTDRFCCAASQRSISNWLSFWGVSDIGPFFTPDQNAGDLYRSPEKLWERSPLKYAAAVKTPTLFIHSDEDYRCPLEQGLQMYSALIDRGVETRLCLFHGENHELSRSGKPKHRLRRLKEITDWFEKHAK